MNKIVKLIAKHGAEVVKEILTGADYVDSETSGIFYMVEKFQKNGDLLTCHALKGSKYYEISALPCGKFKVLTKYNRRDSYGRTFRPKEIHLDFMELIAMIGKNVCDDDMRQVFIAANIAAELKHPYT